MSSLDKIIARIRRKSNDMHFDELRRVLEAMGYTMYQPHSGSSHYTFRKAGSALITIPRHTPINVAYVKMIKDILEANDDKI